MPDRYGTFGSYLADTLDSNRQFARQYADDAALKAYSANPNDPAAIAALTARSPGMVAQLTNARTGALNARVAERTQAGREKAAGSAANFLGGGIVATPQQEAETAAANARFGLPQGNTLGRESPTSITASTTARPGGGVVPAAPNTTQGDEITVNAPRPQLSPQQQVAQLWQEDPTGETAKQFLQMKSMIGGLDEQGRKALGDKADTFGNAVPALQKLPYEARRAAIDAYRPTLLQHGWTENEISDFDPTDQNLSLLLGQAVGAKEILASDDRDRTFGANERERDRDHADAAASRAVTVQGQRMTDARQRDLNAITNGANGKAGRKAEVDLRKEFDALPEVKNFKIIRTQGQQIKKLAKSPSAQNDIAMVFTYMKMLDPGSVVREGEFATAQNAAGVPDRVRNAYNKAQSGELLNPGQRVEMVRSADQIYSAQRDAYNDVARRYKGYAAGSGVNPDNVATTYANKPRAAAVDHGSPAGWKIERVR